MDDEFLAYLEDAKRDPAFRKAFDRAQRRPAWLRRLIRIWDKRPMSKVK